MLFSSKGEARHHFFSPRGHHQRSKEEKKEIREEGNSLKAVPNPISNQDDEGSPEPRANTTPLPPQVIEVGEDSPSPPKSAKHKGDMSEHIKNYAASILGGRRPSTRSESAAKRQRHTPAGSSADTRAVSGANRSSATRTDNRTERVKTPTATARESPGRSERVSDFRHPKDSHVKASRPPSPKELSGAELRMLSSVSEPRKGRDKSASNSPHTPSMTVQGPSSIALAKSDKGKDVSTEPSPNDWINPKLTLPAGRYVRHDDSGVISKTIAQTLAAGCHLPSDVHWAENADRVSLQKMIQSSAYYCALGARGYEHLLDAEELKRAALEVANSELQASLATLTKETEDKISSLTRENLILKSEKEILQVERDNARKDKYAARAEEAKTAGLLSAAEQRCQELVAELKIKSEKIEELQGQVITLQADFVELKKASNEQVFKQALEAAKEAYEFGFADGLADEYNPPGQTSADKEVLGEQAGTSAGEGTKVKGDAESERAASGIGDPPTVQQSEVLDQADQLGDQAGVDRADVLLVEVPHQSPQQHSDSVSALLQPSEFGNVDELFDEDTVSAPSQP